MTRERLPAQAVSAILRVGGLVLRLLLMIVLARAMPLDRFGLFGLYLAGIQLAASLLPLDVYAHSTRELLSRTRDGRTAVLSRHFSFLAVLVMLLGPLATLLFALSLPDGGWLLPALFLLHLALEAVATDISRLLIPLGRPLLANVIIFVRTGAWAGVLAMMVELRIWEPTLSHIIPSWIAGSALSLVIGGIALLRVERMSFLFDRHWIMLALRSSTLFFVATLVFRAVLGLDKFVVQWVLGLEVLGVYTLFAGVSLGVLAIIEAGVSAWRYPPLVASISADDGGAARAHLRRFAYENMAATAGLLMLIGFVFPVASGYLLGPTFNSSMPAFYVILAGVAAFCVTLPWHYVIFAFRRDGCLLTIYGTALTVMLSFGFLIMPGRGVFGASIMIASALAIIALARVVVASAMMSRLPRKRGAAQPH